MQYRNTLRSLQLAARKTLRGKTASLRSTFEPMERRQLMSATAVKSIDSGGPDAALISVSGVTYAITSTASGASNTMIYATRGPASTTKKLVDLNGTAAIGSIDGLVGTSDGRVFFTATGGTGGGRQLFQLNTSKGGYTQITKDTQAFYSHVMAIDNKIFMYDSTHEQIVTLDSKNATKVVAKTRITKLFQAKSQLFYQNGDEGIFRSDGTTGGTYKISGTVVAGSRIFTTNEHIYFEGKIADDNPSLFRSDGSSGTPTKIADDFSLLNTSSAELGDYVYFSGGYYNTSPKGGDGVQLFRASTSTGEVSIAAVIAGSNGAGRPEAIYALGTSIYYTAGDGDYLTSQGTTDRELYRYDTVSGANKKVTTGETIAPVDDGYGSGGGVLGSYYFYASPTKDDFRFGSRKLYRTSPTDDSVEEVSGLPDFDYSRVQMRAFTVGPAGLFATGEISADSGDTDTFFIPTPYSYIDTATNTLVVTATDASDDMTMTVDDDELVMTLNGVEERQRLSRFSFISVTMKNGDDRFIADASVTTRMKVTGDSGNDTLQGGSGDDNILGGAGKNKLYGGAGNDRLRGGGGQDYAWGEAGNDRLYGYGGSDYLHGGDGVDYLYGDDTIGVQGDDSLYGGSGNDRLYGRGGNDSLIGGKQNDTIYGNDGDDVVQGQEGNDFVSGGAGADSVWGHEGDDTFDDEDDGALDYLNGGDGIDTLLGRDNKEKGVELIEVVG